MLLHCQIHPLSMHNLYFNVSASCWPTEPSWYLQEITKCTEFPVRRWVCTQKMITVNVVTCQEGAVLFSDKIQDFPTNLKYTQSSDIMCFLPPVMYGVFDNSGNHSLNGLQFQTHWTDTIMLPPKFGPFVPKQLVILPKLHFLRIEILELPVTKHLWTYW